MEENTKMKYEAPQVHAVELKAEGIVCVSPNRVLWILAGDPVNTLGSDVEWSRSGYGTAEDF